jgi:hypothetical protein
MTPEMFDAVMRPRPRDRIIWTLPAIGARIGAGVDFVRDTLAKQPGSPVHQIGGKWYAFEDDLIAYLRDGPRETA